MKSATSVPCIQFNQFGSGKPGDELLLFAAPAKTLIAWAGIPRKAWHIRMLFQRPITASREAELKRFWDMAAGGANNGFILGPTAIVVALQGPPVLHKGKLDLSFKPIVDVEDEPLKILPLLAAHLRPSISARLSKEQQDLVEAFRADPFAKFPEIEHDYVYEFALQLEQMIADPDQFAKTNRISANELTDIVTSMESLSRPAVVVDGQHRLVGAANSGGAINLAVVGIPNCNWIDQIYQFVVINETAQKVETSLLTDIFGSSLTRAEQEQVRRKLEKSRVNVEERIAAVIASRDAKSPFYNMVRLKIEGAAPGDFNPYLTERTLRVLIEGSTQRYSRGWRTDDEFYDEYVAPTFPLRSDWESWTDGAWRTYWLAFWEVLRSFYNDQARALKLEKDLWMPTEQTNLTKGVTLRQMQTLFMVKCIERMREIDTTAEILRETLGAEQANEKLAQLKSQRAISPDIEVFKAFVHDFFLEKGVPIKVFTASWKESLDDPEGQQELWETLETAFERTRKGERFPVKGRIFVASDND